MTTDELKTNLIADARKMNSAKYIMCTNAHRWAELINRKRYRPYFAIGNKRCITIDTATYLKSCVYSVFNGLR